MRPSPVVLASALLFCVDPLPAQAGMELVVNIAAGRLDVLQDGVRTRSYPVSVGLPAHATPTGTAALRRMVWNPTWTPPDAPWARNERFTGPGWRNPMGRVKMHLFEDYYIHGTPAANEARLGRPASHGCIRMANRDVMELARLVLTADGAPVAGSTVDALAANPSRTRELALRGRVRVRIEYRLTETDANTVTFLPDVYGRYAGRYVERVREDLRSTGLEPDAVGIPLASTRSPATPVSTARMDVHRPVRFPQRFVSRSVAAQVALVERMAAGGI